MCSTAMTMLLLMYKIQCNKRLFRVIGTLVTVVVGISLDTQLHKVRNMIYAFAYLNNMTVSVRMALGVPFNSIKPNHLWYLSESFHTDGGSRSLSLFVKDPDFHLDLNQIVLDQRSPATKKYAFYFFLIEIVKLFSRMYFWPVASNCIIFCKMFY